MIIAALIIVICALMALETYETKHRCSAPGCDGGAWWRVFVVVRGERGTRPEVLTCLATPYRVCGPCFRKLDPRTAVPNKEVRKVVARAVIHSHLVAPAWDRTQVDREHVIAAWLRRGGK